jgi:hypothetical protein
MHLCLLLHGVGLSLGQLRGRSSGLQCVNPADDGSSKGVRRTFLARFSRFLIDFLDIAPSFLPPSRRVIGVSSDTLCLSGTLPSALLFAFEDRTLSRTRCTLVLPRTLLIT